MRISLVLTLAGLAAAAPALAQSPASLAAGRLCSRAVDIRATGARDSVAPAAAGTDTVRAAFFRGCLAMTDGKTDDAATAFERAAELRRDDAVVQLWLARAYGDQALDANVFKKAQLAGRSREHLDQAIKLAPDYIEPRDALIQYLLRAPGMLGGGPEPAQAVADEIAKRNAYRGGLAHAVIARRGGDHAKTERLYRDLMTQYPDSAMPRMELLNDLAAQKKWSDAWKTADDWERAQPRSMSARFAVGRVAAESGEQLVRGERTLRDYLAHEPLDGEPPTSRAHWRLGQVLERAGQIDAAKREYQIAAAMEPKLRPARDALARLP